MRCRNARKRISLLFDGRLNERGERGLRAHLESCGECRAAAAAVEEIAAGLESLGPVEPRRDGWERLARRIDEAQPARRRLAPALAFACTLAAVAALAAVFSLTTRKPAGSPGPRQVQMVREHPVPSPSGGGQDLKDNAPAPEKRMPGNRTATGVTGAAIPARRHLPHRIRHKDAPAPRRPEAPRQEKTIDEEHIASAEPHSNEISDQADSLLARGMSVLIEASAETKDSEGGDHL